MNSRQLLRTGLALLAFAPAAGFALARAHILHVSGGFTSPPTHVIAVGGAALGAMVAALLMVHVARRENDARAGLVGVGFLVMAGLLLIHALATPGFILGEYGRNATVGLAGALAVPAGGIVFAIALIAARAARRGADADRTRGGCRPRGAGRPGCDRHRPSRADPARSPSA